MGRHLILTLLLMLLAGPVNAEVVVDSTFDPPIGELPPIGGPNYQIPSGRTGLAGTNQYVSLSALDLTAEETLEVVTPTNVETLYIRITGSTPARIASQIGSSSGGENVSTVIICTAGIILESGSSFTNGGSIILTTADAVLFSDGFNFSTSDAFLLVSGLAPEGLQFGDDNGEIVVRSGLALTDADLLVAASGITVAGPTLDLNNSAVRLYSFGETTNFAIDHTPESGLAMGPITISGTVMRLPETTVDVRGDPISISNSSIHSSSASGDGLLQLAGNVIGVTNTTIMNSAIGDEGVAFGFSITAQSFELLQFSNLNLASSAPGPTVDITASSRIFLGQSNIRAATGEAEGEAAISIVAPTITLESSNLDGSDVTGGGGGAIALEGDNVTIIDRSVLTSMRSSHRASPAVSISASENLNFVNQDNDEGAQLLSDSVNLEGPEIELRAGHLRVENEVSLESNGELAESVLLVIDGSAEIEGGGLSFGPRPSTSYGAPSLELRSNALTMNDGFIALGADQGQNGHLRLVVNHASLDNSRIENLTGLDAGSGPVWLEGGTWTLINSSILNRSDGGDAGPIDLRLNDLFMSDGSSISVAGVSAVSGETGDSIRGLAGNVIGIVDSIVSVEVSDADDASGITLNAPTVTLDGSQLSAHSDTGIQNELAVEGGDISVLNDTVFTTCGDQVTRSGDIRISGVNVIGLSGSVPEEGATFESCNPAGGEAGDITLDAPFLIRSNTPSFDLSATSGEDGLLATGGADTQLVEIIVFDSHEDCEGRAEIWRLGLDDGLPGGIAGDAILSAEEADGAVLVCSAVEGTADVARLFDSDVEEAGDHCEHGGTRIRSGVDSGDHPNGQLDDEEVTETAFICDEGEDSGDVDEGDSDDSGDTDDTGDADGTGDAEDGFEVAEQVADASSEPVLEPLDQPTEEPIEEVDAGVEEPETDAQNDGGAESDGPSGSGDAVIEEAEAAEAEPSTESSGCSCRQVGAGGEGWWLVLLSWAALLVRKRSR